jgi:hypothetical protein
MNKVITWNCSWDLFEDTDCAKAILEISDGIVIDADRKSQNFYRHQMHFEDHRIIPNSNSLPNSILLLNEYYEDMIKQFPEIGTFYTDEFFSNPQNQGNTNKTLSGIGTILAQKRKLIFGEIDKFPSFLSDDESITYTAYQTLWFKIPSINLRIYKPFSNQIKELEKLEEKYGELQYGGSLASVDYKVRESKFNHCWLKLGKNNTKQIQWCREHSKQICLFIPEGLSKEKFLELMEGFNKCL